LRLRERDYTQKIMLYNKMNSSLSFYYMICILVRLSIAYMAFLSYDNNWRYILVAFFFAASFGFTYLYITKQRKRGAFGQKVWWDFLRPIHAILLFISGVLLSLKVKETYLILLADALIGLYKKVIFCSEFD